MLATLARRTALLALLAAGCTSHGKKRDPQPPVARGTTHVPKPLAIDRPISPNRPKEVADDRELLIPPPPTLAEMSKPKADPKLVDPAVEPAVATDVKSPADGTPPLKLVKNEEGPRESTPVVKADPARVEKDEGLAAMKDVYQRATANYGKMDAFEARLTRRETINGKPNPQEVIRFQFRKQPYSVRLKWIGGDPDAVGREVMYVHRDAKSKMFILPTKADAFPLPARRMSFAPDDSMVRSKTRHDIREAGLGLAVKNLGDQLAAIDKDPRQRGRLKYLGLVQRPEYPSRMHAVEETIPPRGEPLLPKGGKRYKYFDTGEGATNGLPVVVMTYDAAGKEVEYYCFDRFLFPVRLDDADFDPDRAWKK